MQYKTPPAEKQIVIDSNEIFEANDWETIFKIVDSVVEKGAQNNIVEGNEGDAVRDREDVAMRGEEGEAVRGGEGEEDDAVRDEEGKREDEDVENDRIIVEIDYNGFSYSGFEDVDDEDFEVVENIENIIEDDARVRAHREASSDSESALDKDMAKSGDNFVSEDEEGGWITVFNPIDMYDPNF